MRKPRILLADDHRIFLAGLQTLLNRDFEVVATVRDGRTLVAAAIRLKPDVVIADISMPELDGIEAARQITSAAPEIKVVLLTMHADSLFAAEARKAGASGYVLKREPPEILVAAIRLALRGGCYTTPFNSNGGNGGDEFRPGSQAESEPALLWLTLRQRQLLKLTAEGRTLKEIASLLNISVKTVEFHKYRLMKVLGARSSADLVATAIRNRLVSE